MAGQENETQQIIKYRVLVRTQALIHIPDTAISHFLQMSIIMYALTSTSDAEISWCLDTLKSSSGGTGFLHESFNKDDVSTYTRSWFAWWGRIQSIMV